jgi:hypothetical protein
MITWWQMPGPSRMTRSIANDIQAGKNVAICLPKIAPDGILLEIQRLLKPDDFLFCSVKGEDCIDNETPEDTLFRKFAPLASEIEIRTIVALCDQSSFQGRVIFIKDIASNQWPAWKSFLADYESISRTIPIIQRTLFIVKLLGSNALNPPPPEHLLSIYRYDGFVQKIDMFLYVAKAFTNRSLGNVQKQISMSICTELSQWDIRLCDILANLKFETLLNPTQILFEYSQNMGWNDIIHSKDRELLWVEGILQEIDSNDMIHSAVIVLYNERALNHRLWRAELAVIYPLIEEKRQELIHDLQGFLRVPYFASSGEKIEQIQDLEIGHIYAQLQLKSYSYLDGYRQQVTKLRILRNSLAHLECAPTDILGDLRFIETLNIKRGAALANPSLVIR